MYAESGDWIVDDRYDFTSGRISLRRITSIVQGQRRVEVGTAPLGSQPRLKTISVKDFRGRPVFRTDLDYPDLPVLASPAEFPFSKILENLITHRVSTVCWRDR